MSRWVVAVMIGSAVLGGAALLARGSDKPAIPTLTAPDDPATAKVRRIIACRQQRDAADNAADAAARREQIALVARLDGADPRRDAEAAAARGDFRLIRDITMMGTYPMAVACRLPSDNRVGGLPLTLAIRFVSDVPGSCETGGGADPCHTEKLLDAYGPAYNRALVSDPRYPYGDLCRVSVAPITPRDEIRDPVDYGFADLTTTDRPLDLYEAARRGTSAAVEQLIAAAGNGAIDRPDPYGMTPLAWAVARRRPDIAALLLARGANPIGAECDAPDRPESPLRLALRTGQGALATRMLTPAVIDRVTPWPSGLLEAAARGGVTDLLARMLREDHDGISVARLLAIDGFPQPSVATLESFQHSLCWQKTLPRGAGIHMIGVHQSQAAADRGGGAEGMGPVRVSVRASAGPVLLVLSAYSPVEWRIEAVPGARLVGVIALGYYRPTVVGVGAATPVVVNDLKESCPGLPREFYSYEPDDQERVASAIQQTTGAPVRGSQSVISGSAFTIR